MYVRSTNSYIRNGAKVIWYAANIAAAALVGVAAKCYAKVTYGTIDAQSIQHCNVKFGGV